MWERVNPTTHKSSVHHIHTRNRNRSSDSRTTQTTSASKADSFVSNANTPTRSTSSTTLTKRLITIMSQYPTAFFDQGYIKPDGKYQPSLRELNEAYDDIKDKRTSENITSAFSMRKSRDTHNDTVRRFSHLQVASLSQEINTLQAIVKRLPKNHLVAGLLRDRLGELRGEKAVYNRYLSGEIKASNNSRTFINASGINLREANMAEIGKLPGRFHALTAKTNGYFFTNENIPKWLSLRHEQGFLYGQEKAYENLSSILRKS